MLADFCLLDLLPKTGTVPGTILANNPDLFSALRLQSNTASLHYIVSLSSAEVRAKTGNEAAADSTVHYADARVLRQRTQTDRTVALVGGSERTRSTKAVDSTKPSTSTKQLRSPS